MSAWNKIGIAGALALTSAGLAVACGSSGGTTGVRGGGDGPVEVHLTSGVTFSPATLTVEPGTTVRWVNSASLFHTVTPDGHNEWAHRDMPADAEFEHTFTTEGTFPYYCEPHLSQGMTGTITVQASSSGQTY
jgi:plastocyanin